MILYLLAATVVPTKRTRSQDTKQTSAVPSTEIGEQGSQVSNYSLLGTPKGYSILKTILHTSAQRKTRWLKF